MIHLRGDKNSNKVLKVFFNYITNYLAKNCVLEHCLPDKHDALGSVIVAKKQNIVNHKMYEVMTYYCHWTLALDSIINKSKLDLFINK